MGLYDKLATGALRAASAASKPAARAAVQEADPLATLIASRMAGQLQGAGELLGLKNVNLPAAYAGDQRSLGALTRVQNEQETGLASPGRRKFMKQSAATAARSAIPDAVMDAAGAGLLRKAATDAVAETVAPAASANPLMGLSLPTKWKLPPSEYMEEGWSRGTLHPGLVKGVPIEAGNHNGVYAFGKSGNETYVISGTADGGLTLHRLGTSSGDYGDLLFKGAKDIAWADTGVDKKTLVDMIESASGKPLHPTIRNNIYDGAGEGTHSYEDALKLFNDRATATSSWR